MDPQFRKEWRAKFNVDEETGRPCSSWQPPADRPWQSPSSKNNISAETALIQSTQRLQAYMPDYDNQQTNSVEDPQLCYDIEGMGSTVTLREFVGQVSPYTKDKGKVLRRIMDKELSKFSQFIEDVFATWNKDMSDMVAREERDMKTRYQQWTQRIKQRTKINNTWLKEHVPAFKWEYYFKDPQKYLTDFSNSLVREAALGMEKGGEQEGDMDHWRRQNFQRLHWLREQEKKIASQIERLDQELDNSKRKHMDQRTLITMNSELMHEKNAQLAYQIRMLKKERNKLSDRVTQLFTELEGQNKGYKRNKGCKYYTV